MNQDAGGVVQPGSILAGKYRVERILGAGGMGMVIAARHLELGEMRAIKFMLPAALGDPDAVERFLREARAASRLKSQHAVKIHDVGRLETGAPYIVMEYLEGSDLAALSHQRGVLPVPEAASYVLQACEAIGEAHAMGIIHRDLKPANLFLTTGVGGTPCVKVLDFGIAKLNASGGADQPELTASQMVLGSPFFMSPEQMRSVRSVDARSDIWALGVILYKLTTGALPFQGQTLPEVFAVVLGEKPPPAPSTLNPLIPAGFEDIVLRCLEREISWRWGSVAELTAALEPFALAGPNAPRISGMMRRSRPDPAELAPTVGHLMRQGSQPDMTPPLAAAPRPSIPSSQPGAIAAVGDPGLAHTEPPWSRTAASTARKQGVPAGMIFAGSALAGLALAVGLWLARGRVPEAAPVEAAQPTAERPAAAAEVQPAGTTMPAAEVQPARATMPAPTEAPSPSATPPATPAQEPQPAAAPTSTAEARVPPPSAVTETVAPQQAPAPPARTPTPRRSAAPVVRSPEAPPPAPKADEGSGSGRE